MRIGIIGAENSHAAAIAKIINVDKLIKGFSVEYLWGESDALARAAAKAGQIPQIVQKPREMLGLADAIVVDHRHAKYHLPAAKPFAHKGVPIFVDKPFCYRSNEGAEFIKLCRRAGAPLTSFGIVPRQKSFARFQKKLEGMGPVLAASTYGPCDLDNPWGGIFFYGIHQVEIALMAFGYGIHEVELIKNGGKNAAAQLFYSSGLIVTMNLIREGCSGFGVHAVCAQGSVQMPLAFDKNPYLPGVKLFTRMFKTGELPLADKQLIEPIRILEALERSEQSGEREAVQDK